MTTDQSLISVIVPVYNGEKFVSNTLFSILNQTYSNIELIVVDDGSQDSSSKIITEIAEKDTRVKIITKTNGGVANARNMGIANSKGSFIAFCDQDDTWETHKLEKQMKLFAKPDVALVYCGARSVNIDKNQVLEPSFQDYDSGKIFDTLVAENYITCCTTVIRRKALDDVGLYDEDKRLMGADDWHLWLKIAMKYEADFVNEVLCVHVFHGDNYSLKHKEMHAAEISCIDKIEEIARLNDFHAEWPKIKSSLHSRSAQNYIGSGLFREAGKAFYEAQSSQTSTTTLFKSIFFSRMPLVLLRALQRIRRYVKYSNLF